MTLPIFSALPVSSFAPVPSISCIRWSPNGQVCILTKTGIYIITPDPGINFDSFSVAKPPIEDSQCERGLLLGWFRTMIELDADSVTQWRQITADWRSSATGALDIGLSAVATSPGTITFGTGCVVVTLSTNHDVTLWASKRNNLKGEWTKIYDITPFLLDMYAIERPATSLLESQVTSIEWTPQLDFGLIPAMRMDGSLFICGNRAGSLIFLRYCEDGTTTHVMTRSVSTTWVTHLSAGPWTFVDEKTYESQIAYGTPNGYVAFITVRQTLEPAPTASPFGLPFIITATSLDPFVLCEQDKHVITALKWIVTPSRTVIVFTKPGKIYFHDGDPLGPAYSHCLHLHMQKTSDGSSPLHAVTNLHYIPHRDVLVITLADSSCHVVHELSHTPSWTRSRSLVPSSVKSESISKELRSAVCRSEQQEIQESHFSQTNGCMAYDDFGTMIWIYEALQPGDFSYKHEAQHNSLIVTAQLWEDSEDDVILDAFSTILTGSKAGQGMSPLYLLRAIFLHLRQKEKLLRLHQQLLNVLYMPSPDTTLNTVFSPPVEMLSPAVRKDFRDSLTGHLFGFDDMLSLRMKLSFADFAWKVCADTEKQAEYGTVAQQLLNTISHRNLRMILAHLSAVVEVLTPEDIPFILRMTIQSAMAGTPEDLRIAGQHISESLNHKFPDDPHLIEGLNEYCPACNEVISMRDITTAACPNGHVWSRCSVTTFVIATANVRTCIGCTRKSLLPRSISLEVMPDVASGWVVEELFKAVDRCLFCGNSFVSVL